jgi:hypothetical protein
VPFMWIVGRIMFVAFHANEPGVRPGSGEAGVRC